MKIKITADMGEVYDVGSVMEARELIEDYISCIDDKECIEFLRTTDEKTALEFIRVMWGVEYEIEEFYSKPFKWGETEITRGDYECMPCAMCTKDVSDDEMQAIADQIEAEIKEWREWKEQGDITADRYEEKWWECFENVALAHGIPYYEK